jgi:hypothetical protein
MKKPSLSVMALLVAACSMPITLGAAEFSLVENPAEGQLDVKFGERMVARYQFGFDASTPERKEETYKPFLHVYDAGGENQITKGPGGRFPHHRGIFLGWNGIKVNGQSYDRWHMKDGAQVHVQFTNTTSNQEGASFTSQIQWQGREGEPTILVEDRTMRFFPGNESAYLTIDVETTLTAPLGDTELGGDPEHAGLQFRPVDNLEDAKTRYYFPVASADPHKDVDYEWIGMGFTVGDKVTHVLYFNHPENPRGTRFSAYRDYGRFGGFFRSKIAKGDSLSLRARFLFIEGPLPDVEWIQNRHNQFTGRKLPVPELVERKPG